MNYYLVNNKRSSRFMPLRGRKKNVRNDDNEFEDDLTASHPMITRQMLSSMKKAAFVPMRGRKNEIVPYDENDIFFSSLDDYTKRGSFVPLRGRKDARLDKIDDDSNYLR